MQSTDTCDEFIAKLDDSPMERGHGSYCNLMGRLSADMEKHLGARPFLTNPATPAVAEKLEA